MGLCPVSLNQALPTEAVKVWSSIVVWVITLAILHISLEIWNTLDLADIRSRVVF